MDGNWKPLWEAGEQDTARRLILRLFVFRPHGFDMLDVLDEPRVDDPVRGRS